MTQPGSGALAAFPLVFSGGVGGGGVDRYFKQIMSIGNEERKDRLVRIVF